MKYIALFLLFVAPVFAQENLPKSLLLQQSGIQQDKLTLEVPGKLPQLLTAPAQGKKSGALAVLYSLVLPGMGELYGGSYNSGKYFTIADGVIWGVFAGFNIYGNWQRNNYKTFAASYGGINPEGKSADYYSNISEYVNVDEYNRDLGLHGEFDQQYDRQQYYWKWVDQNQRREYRSMWESSERSFNNVRFAVGALIVNRIISAFNAARVVRAYNKNIDSETSWNVSMGIDYGMNMPSALTLNFQKSF